MLKKILPITTLLLTLLFNACTANTPPPQAKEYMEPAQIDDAMKTQTPDLMTALIEERLALYQKTEEITKKTEIIATFQDFATTLELLLYEYPLADPNLKAYILDSSKLYTEYARFFEESKKDSEDQFIAEGVALLSMRIIKDKETGNYIRSLEKINVKGSNAQEKGIAYRLTQWNLNTDSILLYLNNAYKNIVLAPTPTLVAVTAVPVPTEVESPLITTSNCPLRIGQGVILLENSRLWTIPDVTSGTAVHGATGSMVYILDGPQAGPIRHDVLTNGWWWHVSNDKGGTPIGWVWEGHFTECEGE